jgi:hypothetical protein
MFVSADVIDQHSEIGILAGRHVLFLAAASARSVDSCQKAQCRRLFIAGCPEELAGKIQPLNLAALEVPPNLAGRHHVVLDRIAVLKKHRSLKTRDAVHHSLLDISGEARREAVHIDAFALDAFRLEEEGVPVMMRESHHLILDRGTVTGADSVDHAGKKRRPVEVGADDLLHYGWGARHPTWAAVLNRPRPPRKGPWFRVAFLHLETRQVETRPLEPRWSAGLEAAELKPKSTQ